MGKAWVRLGAHLTLLHLQNLAQKIGRQARLIEIKLRH